MALKNFASWSNGTATESGSACGSSDNYSACGSADNYSACGASDK